MEKELRRFYSKEKARRVVNKILVNYGVQRKIYEWIPNITLKKLYKYYYVPDEKDINKVIEEIIKTSNYKKTKYQLKLKK